MAKKKMGKSMPPWMKDQAEKMMEPKNKKGGKKKGSKKGY